MRTVIRHLVVFCATHVNKKILEKICFRQLLQGRGRVLRQVLLLLLTIAASHAWAEGTQLPWKNGFYPTEDGLHASWQSALTTMGEISAGYTTKANAGSGCITTFSGYSIGPDNVRPIQYDPYTHVAINATADMNFLDTCTASDGSTTLHYHTYYNSNPYSTVGVLYPSTISLYQCWDNTTVSSAADCPAKPVCPAGQVANSGIRQCGPITKHAKQLGCPPCDKSPSKSPNSTNSFVKDPINIAIANLYEKQVDYAGNGLADVRFVRSYNSGDDAVGVLGPGWHHNYDRHIDISADGTLATFTHGDGRVANYRPYLDNTWITDTDEVGTLTRTTSGWTYQLGNAVETYDSNGRLLSLTNENGLTQTLTYNSTGQLARVDGVAGTFLTFSYSGDGTRLLAVSDPTRIWHYQYDTNGRLIAVVNPDDTTRQYLYEDSTNSTALTGLIDGRGIRYSTWGYDAQGRAILATHANNADYGAITYPSDTMRTVTDGRGNTTTYTMLNQNGSIIVSAIDGPACATCGGSSHHEEFTYNNEYHEILSKTVDGVTTQYNNYDANHNPSIVTEAVGTPQQRQIHYIYDPHYFSKVLRKTEPSMCAGQSKVTNYKYDKFGDLTSVTINGFTPDCTAESRTTTMQYNGPLHQLSQIDGPRTDVNDVIIFTYYPDDASQGNNRARLQRVTLANGTAARDNIQYSSTGKVLSETRINGLILSYTYYPGNDRLQTVSESDWRGI